VWGALVGGRRVNEGDEGMKVRVCGRWTSYTYMKWNKETSCNCFKWGGEGVVGEKGWDDLTKVHHKPNRKCHYESPPPPHNNIYNEYILIKTFYNKKERLLSYY
jgi:hypothetical protein